MVQGGSRFSQDIPPYVIVGKDPVRFAGINLVGLRRRGFSNELIDLIHKPTACFIEGLMAEGIQEIRNNLQVTKEIQYIIDFVESSKRGIVR